MCAGCQFLVGNAAGLDGNQSFAAIDPADIAERVKHKAAANQFQVRFEHLFAQCLQQHRRKMRDRNARDSSGRYFVNVYATEH